MSTRTSKQHIHRVAAAGEPGDGARVCLDCGEWELRFPFGDELAEFLAQRVFDCGIGPGKTIRLSLRGGELGTTRVQDETDRGGLCKTALARVLAEALRQYKPR